MAGPGMDDTQILRAINRILRAGLEQQTEHEVAITCLATAKELTRSDFGFLARLTSTGVLKGIGGSGTGSSPWTAIEIQLPSANLPYNQGVTIADLYRHVIVTGQPVINHSMSPLTAATPDGHPVVSSCLAVPLKAQGRVAGLVAVANRSRPHNDSDRSVIEATGESMAQVLWRRRPEPSLEAELRAARLLQSLSTQLIQADNIEELYERILDTAVAIMDSDFASIQEVVTGPDGSLSLRLLGHRGFGGEAASFWGVVTTDSNTTCAQALRARQRAIISNVDACDILPPSRDLDMYHRAGIQAVQTTPLLSRSGALLGMLSTHWRVATSPSEAALRHMDLLARQAADFIDRKIAEDELRQADAQKNHFLAVLSHELRNPLAVITGGLALLKQTGYRWQQINQTLAVIERQTQRLSRLIDDLLDVTRIARNKIILRSEPLDLHSLLLQVVEDHQVVLGEHEVTLDVSLKAESTHVRGDPARLAQVFANLLDNAAKFSPKGSIIRVSTANDHPLGQISVRVRDSGVGISSEIAPHLFQPFVQADPGHAGHGGLGLGLTLVKSLTEMHGGAVSVTSNGRGQGAEFVIRLPCLGGPPQQAKAPETATPRISRILLIEDNQDLCSILSELLRADGHEVLAAGNAGSGLTLARQWKPDAIICDIGLPGVDGYSFARMCRDDDCSGQVLLIAMTGYARPEDVQRAAVAGFDHHLAKPIKLPELYRLLGAR